MSCAHLWNHHWQGSFNVNCDFFKLRHFDIFRWYTIGERLGKEVLTCWPEIKYTQLLLHFSYVLRIFIKILNEFLFEFLTNVTYDCWAPCYLQVQKIIWVTTYLGIESKCKCSQFLRKKVNKLPGSKDWLAWISLHKLWLSHRLWQSWWIITAQSKCSEAKKVFYRGGPSWKCS